MPKIDPGDLHPTLAARLRAELDHLQPPHGEPRYLTSGGPLRAFRLAPIALAIACTGIVALTAFAATGSPNPAVWTNKVQTVINPPSPSPSPEDLNPTPTQPPAAPVAAPTHAPTHAPTSSPEHESPEPEDAHQSPRPTGSPTPSPSGDH